jgi:nitroimidazol reductase NimA-like FMN-containing flavoprotein (pyridoxamine 5'-phosphate oxidase superfamily)
MDDAAAQARGIVDANRFMTLATADAQGLPWASPVWYATEDYRTFVWVSKPEARHSQNIGAQPTIAIVVFDSQVAPGAAQALYMRAQAGEVADSGLEAALELFSRRSLAQNLKEWTLADVQAPARHRLYRATASEQFILSSGDERLPVEL